MTAKTAEAIFATTIAIAIILAITLLAPKSTALGDAHTPIFRPLLPLVY